MYPKLTQEVAYDSMSIQGEPTVLVRAWPQISAAHAECGQQRRQCEDLR